MSRPTLRTDRLCTCRTHGCCDQDATDLLKRTVKGQWHTASTYRLHQKDDKLHFPIPSIVDESERTVGDLDGRPAPTGSPHRLSDRLSEPDIDFSVAGGHRRKASKPRPSSSQTRTTSPTFDSLISSLHLRVDALAEIPDFPRLEFLEKPSPGMQYKTGHALLPQASHNRLVLRYESDLNAIYINARQLKKVASGKERKSLKRLIDRIKLLLAELDLEKRGEWERQQKINGKNKGGKDLADKGLCTSFSDVKYDMI